MTTTSVREHMGTFGDIAMNLGDQFYPLTRGDTLSKKRLESADVLARLLAYAVIAESVTFPSRYVLSEGPLYEALHTAPQLLESGIVRIALYEGVSSFEELARDYGYPADALPRAIWLDEHVASKRIYKPNDHGAAFMATLLADLAPGGALRRLVPGGKRGAAAAQIDRITEFFASGPPDRQRLAEGSVTFLPQHTSLFRRWAAMRYYTVPLLFDNPGCIRELPKSAARLVANAEAAYGGHATRAPVGIEEAAPFHPVIHQLLIVPALKKSADPAAVNLIVEAMLEIRDRHKGARRSFLRVVEQTSEASADLHEEAYAKLSLKKYRPIAARNEDKKVFSGLL